MPSVTAKGLESIGLTLEVAYPERSWQAVVLTNHGEHHIIAAVLLYEITSQDGKKALAREVILDPNVSLESDPAKIKRLLVKHPVIPPYSRWLTGVGVDRIRMVRGLPSFEDSRSFISLELPTVSPPKSIDITIDGAILGDGRILGPQRENTKQWISDMTRKLIERKP